MRLVYLALGWAAGIILAERFFLLPPLLWVIALGAAVFALYMAWDTRWRWLFFAVLAFALGGYRFGFVPTSSDIAQYNQYGNARIEGIIVAEPDIRDDRVQIRVEAETISFGSTAYPTSGLILVNAPRFVDLQYGDRIGATGRMAQPAEYDTFSYADYLARSGVFSILQNASVEVLSSGEGNPIYSAILQLKAHLQSLIEDALPAPQSALLTGILLGNERGLDPALQEDFARTGAAHIIAISGFNMAIIAGIVMNSLGRVIRRPWLAALLGIAVVALYTILVGANAAVVRAAFMSSLLVIASALNRKAYVPASLAFSVIVLSFISPLVLWDISFQLSFFAVLGLALFADPLSKRFDAALRWLFPGSLARVIAGLLNEPLIVSIAALITTLPLTLLYFQRLSVVSLLVNVLVVPVQSYLLLIGGFAVLVALVLPSLAQIFFWIDWLLLSWSIGVVRLFGDLTFADAVLIVDSRLILVFLGSIVGGAIVYATRPTWTQRFARFLRLRPVFNAIVFSGIAVAALLVAIGLSRPDGRLHLWWLDVGHSNAVLIQSPGGAQILVDGGRFPSRLLTSLGDRMPFYDTTLELLVITQPDEFDTAALPAVLGRYDTSVVLVNGQPNLSPGYTVLAEALSAEQVIEARAGYEVQMSDGLHIEVLHPLQQPTLEDSLGDVALVLRITYGEVSFLLTSDLSQQGQALILENGYWPLSDVLHLPQHGTARSLNEDFVLAVQPQVAILQSDAANFRGDPDANTLALLGETPLFRTDEMGALHLETDGSALWVTPERS